MRPKMNILTVLMFMILVCGCRKQNGDPASGDKSGGESSGTHSSSGDMASDVSSSGQWLTMEGWEPTEELLNGLYPETDITGYLIRPPKDYLGHRAPDTPPGTTMVGFVGNRRSDGTSPMVQVMISTPPDDGQKVELEEFLTAMLKGVERTRTSWSQTPFEEGDLNGLKCLRTRWSGTDKTTNRKMHGVMYAAVDGRTFISIHTQDVEPYHVEALPLGEAAALTFRKK